MRSLYTGLPVLAAFLVAVVDIVVAVDYPTKPADLTTPVQQRIAINGANGE